MSEVRVVERPEAASGPRGIGGWLLLVAILEVATSLVLFVLIGTVYQNPEVLDGSAGLH